MFPNLFLIFLCCSASLWMYAEPKVGKIIFIADPRILSIPVQENGEDFVDLRSQSILLFGPSPEIPDNKDYTKMRRSVYERLVKAQKSLPSGLRFCLYEGYRSLPLQNRLFEAHYGNLKKHHPSWSHKRIFKNTTRLVSPVTNLDGSRNVPPHSTGGAIDVYLVTLDGQPVDMGIHPKDWALDMDGSLSLTHSKKISKNAQKNRTVMSTALKKAGFVNYPTEFWHWSFGDRYWAYHKKKRLAIYGSL